MWDRILLSRTLVRGITGDDVYQIQLHTVSESGTTFQGLPHFATMSVLSGAMPLLPVLIVRKVQNLWTFFGKAQVGPEAAAARRLPGSRRGSHVTPKASDSGRIDGQKALTLSGPSSSLLGFFCG